jgi:hypothetical protein
VNESRWKYIYFIKIGVSRLKQCPNQKQKLKALKYTIDFVKTCNF